MLALILFVFTGKMYAQNASVPGEVIVPFPTLVNLAVEWYIEGDNNLNGTVSIQFRERGTREWKKGMPLRRVPSGENIGFKWDNKHSGSIFDLEPDTEYEIKLNLEDPDGGNAEKIVTAKTRPEPLDRKSVV